MSLRRKTLFVGTALVVGLIVTVYVILSGILAPNFAEIEQQSTIRDVQRVMNAVSNDLANLNAQARDYAAWDDMYAFVEDANADFIATNLPNEVYDNYQLNLVLVVKTTGEIVYGNGYDLIRQQLEPVPDDLLKRLTINDRLLQHPTLEGTTGILMLPAGAMLLASQPILTSTDTEPSRGALIMGRYLSASEIDRLGQTTQLLFSISRVDDPQLPEVLKTAADRLSNERPITSQPLDDNTVSGLGLLNDFDGNPALLLRVDEPRTIYQQGQVSLRYLVAALLAAGLLFAFLSLLFLDRSILARVAQLNATIGRIDTQHDLSARVPVTGNDELAGLAKSFNNMTTQLKSSLDLLENRVQTRTAQLQASADVGRAVTSILDPDQLLKQVVTLLTERFGFYYAGVFLIDEAGHWALLREASGPGDAASVLKQSGHKLEVGGQSMVSTAITTRRPRIALDVGQEAVRFANPMLPATHSEIALPLTIGDRVLGALDVQSIQIAAFDEANATVLQSMADQIAIALNNAAQYRREQSRVAQITGLLQAALELSIQPDRRQLLDRITQLTMSLLDADGAGLWFPIDDATLELQFTINIGAADMTGRRLRIGEGLSGQVFANGLTLRVDNYLTWPGRAAVFSDAPFRSALGVPMSWQGQTSGVLAITRSLTGHPFTAEDENIAQLVAAQAAAALENLRLRAAQQRSVEELDAINRRLTGEAWQTRALGAAIRYEFRQHAASSDAAIGLSMEVPIMLRDTPIGSITIQDQRPRELTGDEHSLIDSVVQQMALALENQRLLEQTERRAQREQFIAEISRKMLAATDMSGIIRIAGDELSDALGVRRTEIKLGLEALEPNGQSQPEHEPSARS